MSFRGWVNTLGRVADQLAPRCPQCNRKMRHRVCCKVCRQECCSHNCFERHLKAAHADVLEEQRQAKRQYEQQQRLAEKEQALLAERLLEEQARAAREERAKVERKARERAEEDARRTRIKAARTKKEKLERIREEIIKATESLEGCTAAWQQAGSPMVRQAEVDGDYGKVRELRTALSKENRKRDRAFAKMTYLRVATYTRQTLDQYNIPWFAPVLIFAAVCFALTVVIVLPFTKGHTIALSLGGIGFLAGLTFMLCLFFVPSNEGVELAIATTKEEQQKGQQARKEAWAAYEVARDEYERLARLRQLRTDCDNAAQRKLHLEEEYQVALVE